MDTRVQLGNFFHQITPFENSKKEQKITTWASRQTEDKTRQDKKRENKRSDLIDSISLERHPLPDPRESQHIPQEPHAGKDQNSLKTLRSSAFPRHAPTETPDLHPFRLRFARNNTRQIKFLRLKPHRQKKNTRKSPGNTKANQIQRLSHKKSKAVFFHTSNESDRSTEQEHQNGNERE